MSEIQQNQLSSCPQDRPICLNKPIKKRYIKGHKYRGYYTKKNEKRCKRTKKGKPTIYV